MCELLRPGGTKTTSPDPVFCDNGLWALSHCYLSNYLLYIPVNNELSALSKLPSIPFCIASHEETSCRPSLRGPTSLGAD
ncbi:hypothetical protein CDV31_000422 [Fusarium ambrosium]|uniref:Uncharacterized protein n=1 Tax=Fusarium ambrosium TaxID=131363 RepID=A0A428V2G9_9HYPO|nr:hypothetical protein CDV31_000422 [Fusarium ambrosium]